MHVPGDHGSRAADPLVAEALLKKLRRTGIRLETGGADRGFQSEASMKALRQMKIRPHISRIENRRIQGVDARTARHASCRVSHKRLAKSSTGPGSLA